MWSVYLQIIYLNTRPDLSADLVSDIVHGHIVLPITQYSSSRLAHHEQHLLSLLRVAQGATRTTHDSLLLLEAIGQRMAFDAATAAHIPEALLRLYEVNSICSHRSAYVERDAMMRQAVEAEELTVLAEAYHEMEGYLRDAGMEKYATALMAPSSVWEAFVDTLPAYYGEGKYEPLGKALARL